MKHLKKVILLIFAVSVMVSIFMMTEISSSAATYSGTCGDNVNWSLDTSTGVLNITGSGDMYDYSSSETPWNSNLNSIKTVNIGDFVTSIGDYAFYDCRKLTSVTIGDSVTSIGRAVFHYCFGLTSVTIPDSVTSIDYQAFANCEYLTSVTIGDSVTSIGNYAFDECIRLKSVTIGDSVASIGNRAFYDCTSLTSVTIPDSVVSIGNYAFSGYTYGNDMNLASVTIGDSVTSIGINAFSCCDFLTSVQISDIASWCAIDFDNFASNPLYYAKDLYLNEKLVTDLIIPDSVTRIGDYVFDGCASLKSVTIPDSVTSIGDYVFDNCTSLTSVTIPDSVTSIGDSAFNTCGSLTSVTIPDSVTSIGDNTFSYCISLKSVTIGASVTSIGNFAFSYCTSLTSMVLGDSVTSIGSGVFEYCSSLTTVTIPNSVTSISDSTFSRCTVTIACYQNSVAHNYALKNNIPYKLIFTDIKESHWFYDAVSFVVQKGYMNGMSKTVFSPNSNITREQFVLILANIAGVNTDEYKNISSGFDDVKTGQWYSGAVTWAVREGYVSGMSANKFGRGQSIQRAALARMLYNYAEKNGIDTTGRANLSSFGDAAEFEKSGNAWMLEPVQWAVDAGIISGMNVNGKNCVNPKGTATRAQAARMLMQFDSIAPKIK